MSDMIRHQPSGPHVSGWSHSSNITTPDCPPDCPVVLEQKEATMLRDTDIKITPRIAHSIDDFEVGQRVRWVTDEYAGKYHRDETGVVVEDEHGNFRVEYDLQDKPWRRWDYIIDHNDGLPANGLWIILEDAPEPEPEVDQAALNLDASIEMLRVSLAAYDGRRLPLFGHFDRERRIGLAALPDLIEDARNAVRRYDEAKSGA